MSTSKGPRTVGIIMDGNRRWARKHALSIVEGHEAGKAVLQRFLDSYEGIRAKWGTENYIFYAFSTENWNRTLEEVAALMGIFQEAMEHFQAILPQLKSAGIRIRFLGQREKLSVRLQTLMETVESSTAEGTSGIVALAISYGGHADILQAVNQLIERGEETVTQAQLRDALWTRELPDPDLIIRPGGEKRLSNFLTWESAYAELAFTDTLWPDFTQAELEQIFTDYAERERRKGK